jgi:hypothetical protein
VRSHSTPGLGISSVATPAIMPIVTNPDNTTMWSGTSQVTVVGFPWFFISGCANAGKEVDGAFVKLSSVPSAGQSSGVYSSYGTATTVALTSNEP